MVLLCNNISHWLGTSLESSLFYNMAHNRLLKQAIRCFVNSNTDINGLVQERCNSSELAICNSSELAMELRLSCINPSIYVLCSPLKYCMQYHDITRLVDLKRPSDAISWHRYGSILVQVMACYLTALNHYHNQCWLNIIEVQWHPRTISQEIPQLSITKISQL